MRSLNVVLSWVIKWSMMALQLKNKTDLINNTKTTTATAVCFLLLTGWHRKHPSGRRCGPWRGQRPPFSRHGECTGTHSDCSKAGCKRGSWGRCGHCQEIHEKQLLKLPLLQVSFMKAFHWEASLPSNQFLFYDQMNHDWKWKPFKMVEEKQGAHSHLWLRR